MAPNIENDTALLQALAALEVERKKIAAQKITDEVFTALCFIGLSVSYFLNHLLTGIAVFIVFMLILSIRYAFRNDKLTRYRERYKREALSAALKFIDPNLTFNPSGYIDAHEFEYSQLYDGPPDFYGSEDLVAGSAGKTAFYFAEAFAEYKKEYQDKDGRKRPRLYEIFKGIIFVADFNKNFNRVTVVKPKAGKSAVGAWLSKNVSFFADENLIRLENTEFDKTFVTYSSDQVEARYILTPAMMESILKLNHQSIKTIRLSFTGSKMYIAFPLNRNYFEAPIFGSLLKPVTLYTDINVIKFMYDIVKELNLNTRIWGKE